MFIKILLRRIPVRDFLFCFPLEKTISFEGESSAWGRDSYEHCVSPATAVAGTLRFRGKKNYLADHESECRVAFLIKKNSHVCLYMAAHKCAIHRVAVDATDVNTVLTYESKSRA